MKTWHIHIEGKVQGVGFRPYIYQKAVAHQVKGWVSNGVDGVHLEFNASIRDAEQFYKVLLQETPILAQVTNHRLYRVAAKAFKSFEIVHSTAPQEVVPNLLVTPDAAICNQCLEDLGEKGNRRKNYPFTTCTNCGPRYSIIRSLPYDRPTTTMKAFDMCTHCREEYLDVTNRRYFSQTNSCPKCTIQLSLYNMTLGKIEEEGNLENTVTLIHKYWQEGKIVAIKGIGGYILTCDATNESAILDLRRRKYRPSKPFAIMCPDLSRAMELVRVEEWMESSLQFPIAPIVLLPLNKTGKHQIKTQVIAPGLDHLGIMLPYTPLYALLLKTYSHPIVATSGNVSHSPIIFQDQEALKDLNGVADYVLLNNREIVVPQDDSVIKFSQVEKRTIVIRRSRGMAPTYIQPGQKWTSISILATGAMLKSTITLQHAKNVYISQYIGDLDHFKAQENYHHTYRHLSQLLKFKPAVVLSDLHPDYPSTQFAEIQAKAQDLPILKIQHHLAHFSSVIGENDLIHSEEPILGVIWDGTGLGEDHQIWGGEFFTYRKYNFQRQSHFSYFDAILGDKMAREPRISALSCCWKVPGMEVVLRDKFTAVEWKAYRQILNKSSNLQSSSVGRVFDAVASLLGIMDKQSFEGEAAIRLETMARSYFSAHGFDFSENYFPKYISINPIPIETLMANVILDLKNGKSQSFISAKFHYSLVQLIKEVATHLKVTKIAFSGGVFQNSVLVDLIDYHLSKELSCFFHQQLSPNDENISFGQLVYYKIQQQKKNITKNRVEGATVLSPTPHNF